MPAYDGISCVPTSQLSLLLRESRFGLAPTRRACSGALWSALVAGRVFVGRERELETIRAAVGEAASGRFGVVVIAGEPGVGKTRLADMALQSAAELGVTVARGIASDGEVAAPYLPWRQVLRSIPGAAELAHAAGLSSLFPELGATGAGPADDRLSMFDAVVGVLSQLAGGGGLVVVLEDLQWADEPTLRALVHVARARPPVGLLVVGTYRDTELIGRDALTAALGELSLQSDVTRLRLAGLDAGEVAALVAAIGPDNLARLAEIDRRSGGNPFFVIALAELATSSAIPAAVRDVVRGRMRRLTPGAAPIVAAAATLGEDLDPVVVSAAVEQPVDRVLAAFDEAQEVGILRREPGWQFTHDLVRECAEADLPTARRAGIHRVAARYLAGRSDAAERVYEIANHHLAAIPVVDADEVMRWVLRAAGAAIDRLAWETAEALLTRVVAGGLDVSLLDRIEAYRLLAVARCRSFDQAGAEVALRSAVELAGANSCDGEVLAGLLLTVEGMADPDWLPWLRDALRGVLARGDHPTAVAARLTAELAFQEAFFDQQSAGVLSLRSSELADQSADLVAQRASWRAQHFASSGPDGVRRRLELADRMEASASDDGDPEAVMWGRLWRFDALLQLGDIAGAEQQAARLTQLAGLATSSSARWHTLRCAMTLATARGRFDDALEAAGQAFALAAATGNRAIAGLMAVPVLWVSAMTGRHELAEPLVGELGRSPWEYAAAVVHWWSVQTREKVAASDGYDLRPLLRGNSAPAAHRKTAGADHGRGPR